jgi:hypothetical protein
MGYMHNLAGILLAVFHCSRGAIAKWLRRQIRNLFLFEGAGSNPAGVVWIIFPNQAGVR